MVARPDLGGCSEVPRARAVRDSPQSIPGAELTAVAFEHATWDTDGMFGVEAGAARLTAATGGLYVISAGLEWEPNPLGRRTAVLRIDGAVNIAFDQCLAVRDAETVHTICGQYLLHPGDFVELLVRQGSGGPLSLGGAANVQTNLSVAWLGP